MTTLHPNLKWFQTKTTLNLIVDHRDVKGEKINIESSKISIEFSGPSGNYSQELPLLHEVDKE